MSPSRTQEVRCPKCGQTHSAEVHDLINVAQAPALKAELLSTRLFQRACPSCGARWHASQTLLYHDVMQGFLIWLYPGEKTDEVRDRLTVALERVVGADTLAVSTARLVGSPHDLIEKVLIFDAGLSDMLVEIVKVMASSLVPAARGAKLRFSPKQEGLFIGKDLPFAAVRPGEQKVETLIMPWAQYAMITERFPGMMIAAAAAKGKLVAVDEAFAVDAIKAISPAKKP